MKYNREYKYIFASARCALNEDLKTSFEFMKYGSKTGHKFSWAYISIVANELTAYNELNSHDFFVRSKHFL